MRGSRYKQKLQITNNTIPLWREKNLYTEIFTILTVITIVHVLKKIIGKDDLKYPRGVNSRKKNTVFANILRSIWRLALRNLSEESFFTMRIRFLWRYEFKKLLYCA